MRNPLWGSMSGLISAGITALTWCAILAQGAQQARAGSASGGQNIAGVWVRAETARTFNRNEEPPMRPEAARYNKAVREGTMDAVDLLVQSKIYLEENNLRPDPKGRDDLDPMFLCAPPGPTRILMLPRPFEIVQQPSRILMLFEWDHLTRQIFMDGRGHPEFFPNTWMGHATGSWQGDTLVVSTALMNEYAWVDSAGHPQSDDMRIEERYQRTAPDRLELNLTFNDPKTYTRPWMGSYAFKLLPKREIAEHIVCEDWLELPSDPRP